MNDRPPSNPDITNQSLGIEYPPLPPSVATHLPSTPSRKSSPNVASVFKNARLSPAAAAIHGRGSSEGGHERLGSDDKGSQSGHGFAPMRRALSPDHRKLRPGNELATGLRGHGRQPAGPKINHQDRGGTLSGPSSDDRHGQGQNTGRLIDMKQTSDTFKNPIGETSASPSPFTQSPQDTREQVKETPTAARLEHYTRPESSTDDLVKAQSTDWQESDRVTMAEDDGGSMTSRGPATGTSLAFRLLGSMDNVASRSFEQLDNPSHPYPPPRITSSVTPSRAPVVVTPRSGNGASGLFDLQPQSRTNAQLGVSPTASIDNFTSKDCQVVDPSSNRSALAPIKVTSHPSKRLTQTRKYHRLRSQPLQSTYYFCQGRLLTGGDSPLPMIASFILVLGLGGLWLGTTGVWMWRSGLGGGGASAGGKAAVIIFAYILGVCIGSMAATAFRDPGKPFSAFP